MASDVRLFRTEHPSPQSTINRASEPIYRSGNITPAVETRKGTENAGKVFLHDNTYYLRPRTWSGPERRKATPNDSSGKPPSPLAPSFPAELPEDSGISDILSTVKSTLPKKPLYSIRPSLIPLPTNATRPSCVEEVALVFQDDTPPCLLIVTQQPADDKIAIQAFANTLARELTNVLQSQIPDPICIVPVFVERQQLVEVKTIMQETLSKVKRYIPYGRWLMTVAKKNSLVKAFQAILNP